MRRAKLLAHVSIITLALLSTGLTWGVAEVESRSSMSWGSQDQTPPEGSSLDLLKKMEHLQQEVQELRGKVEEQAYQLQQVQDSQKKLYLDLDSRIGNHTSVSQSKSAPAATTGINLDDKDEITIPDSGGIDLDNPKSASTNTKATSKTLSAVMPSPEAIVAEEKAYQQAYRLVQRKDYDGAVAAFQSLNQRFPQGKYLPNANYWLGEIYLTRQQYELAAKSFEGVYQQFPQHPKAADALLKMGYVAYGQGQFKRAESIFNQVKSKYAGSTSSQLADAKLSQLQHDGRIT